MVAKQQQQQNHGGELAWAATEPPTDLPQLVAQTEVVAAQRPKTETWTKPKKGSVFPAKRKLVKTMVYESIMKFVAPVFCPRRLPPLSDAQPGQPEPNKKCKQILPHPTP